MMVWFLPWLSLLLLLLPSPFYTSSFSSPPFAPPPLCHPHESSALLHFRNSFPIVNYTSLSSYCASEFEIANPNTTMTWNMSRDCCTWNGVTCDEVSGHVIGLDLFCSGLDGVIHSNNSLFFLIHLQSLVLSHNQLDGSEISPQFGWFSSMIHLDLSDSGFTGHLPLELSFLSSLVTLDLSDLTLETLSLKKILANLTSLRELSLIGVTGSYFSTDSFMNLSISLLSLDLSESGLIGKFPENIFHLPNLQELRLSYIRNLTGSFPRHNWTSPLRELGLPNTGFLIDLPYLLRNLKHLTHLDASDCGLTGSLTLSGNNTQITSLDLSSNNFGGQFPWDFLNLEKLSILNLYFNKFEGQLPEICRNSTKKNFLCDSSKNVESVGPLPLNLKFLFLSGNLFNGTIPSWLGSLPYLVSLGLGRNQFSGHICEFQWKCLEYLELSSNNLHGPIPRSIFQLVDLSYLLLSSNSLSGAVHVDQLVKLKNLDTLDLSFNSLSIDSINSMSALPSTLKNLYLSSCNITGFPYYLKGLQYLEQLDLSDNRIEGSVPEWLWNVGKDSLSLLNISHNLLTHIGRIPWRNLEYIDLGSNRLDCQLPIPPPSTTFFPSSKTQLVGEILPLFCNLSQIEVLVLSNNCLHGSLPPCFGITSRKLSVLDLRMNRFHGTIPPTFLPGNSLRTLNLNRNQLEGPLPHSLVNCENLEVLDVGNNKLNGSFPFWLESLPELHVLILRANRFSGPISDPKARFPFQKLRIIDLSDNEFTGLLPIEYFRNFAAMMDARADSLVYMNYSTGSMIYYQDSVVVVMKGFYFELVKIQTLFITIDCSRNYFIGEIPELIGKLNSLKGLNLSYNKLTGLIPPSLGNLSNLEWLDLSSNKLSGKIPLQLEVGLNQLGFLNLSNNELTGPIPRGKQFDTFDNDSYGGNMGLCGFPLSKSCSNHEAQQDEGNDHDGEDNHGLIDWKVVTMGYASGLVIGISIGYMVLFSRSFDYWFSKRFGGGRHRRTRTRSRGWRRPN